jgi:hypothetical protein
MPMSMAVMGLVIRPNTLKKEKEIPKQTNM